METPSVEDKVTYGNFQPAVGQWYVVVSDHDGYVIERLVGWVTTTGPNRIFSVSPVGQSGYPIDEDTIDAEGTAVAGDDRAPDGRTWHEVYNDPPPASHWGKRIDDIFSKNT